MRDQFLLRPFGGLSIRNFLLFFATLIVATFAYLFAAPTAHAATDITWKDGNIVYGGNTYSRKDDIKAGSTTGLPEGTKIFTFFSGTNGQEKAQIIYFSKDTDPATAESANFVTYDVISAGDPIVYGNPTNKKKLSATPQSTAEKDAQTTSCDVEGGLGWIICPLTNTLSHAMDKIFDFLTQFLEVQPVSTDQESSMFRAWSMMRNFANICFVIGFLIVIYSQLSNIGLSNYGIKKMLPRLVIAAVLVNISYWICAVGVDLSNIAGHSISGIFEAMRNNLTGTGQNEHDIWSNLSGSVLAGTTFAIATGVGIHTFATAAGGAVYMLLPILLGVMLTALVALIIMAARQALITIMIIIAPLAFVAYLLPNTEKYFKKWHELFTTMLMVFPAFAVVFSGSQLAGDVIIQNANSIIIVILGLAVKIAPIAITPLLMKVSGSLLGKVAGVVNNPRKGILDRTRNMAQERADAHTSRALAGNKAGFLGINKAARSIDSNKRKREGWKKANDARADANWANTDEFGRIHHYDANSHLRKEIGENAAARHTAIAQLTNASDQNLDLRARASKLDLDVSKAKVEANWEEIKAGDGANIVTPAGVSTAGLQRYINEHTAYAQNATMDTAIEARRLQSAQNMQQTNLSQALHDNVALQQHAGGIDPNGAQRALADALKKKHEIRGEAVKNANSIIDNANVNNDNLVELSKGLAGTSGITVTEDIQEAAIKKIGTSGNIKAIQDMLDGMNINTLTENHRIALSESLISNGSRPKYVSASAASAIAQGGTELGVDGVNKLIRAAVDAQKYSPEVLASQDDYTLKRLLEDVKTNSSSYNPAALVKLRESINEAKGQPLIAAKLGEREKTLDELLTHL
jgi:hypothetical protein